MSLAPAERQALARIEDSLRRSDPRLASMLTQFRLPLTRRLPRLGPFVLLMGVLAVVFLLVVTAVLSPAKLSRCGLRRGPDFATAVSQVTGCPHSPPGLEKK